MMKTLLVTAVLSLLPALGAVAQPLPGDPSLVRGTLPNGLSYIVRKHQRPPERVAVWMHVHAGSLNETERQRGVAHFLEHMAFNGSENFPPGTVVPFFENLGMTFGRHQNAFTSFDQTTYQVSLPDNKPETLAKGLLFMADVNSRLLLNIAEIDAERGIIMNEKTARKSAQQRVQEAMLARSTPGSLYSQRLPIGVDETLKSMNRDDFAAFYKDWYGPANSTLIVVGDIEPAVAVAEIAKAFAGDGPAAARPSAPDPGVKAFEKPGAWAVTDDELTRAQVGFVKVSRPLEPTTTVEQLRREFVQSLASSAFNRRMTDKVSKGGVSYQNAFAGVSESARAVRTTMATAGAESAKWRDALNELAAELQRARGHGFTEREITDAKRAMMSGFEQSKRVDDSLPMSAHLGRINGGVASGETIMSAEQRLEMGRKLLPGITREEINAWFAAEFDPATVQVFAQVPASASPPTDDELLKFGQAALAAAPPADVEASRADTLMKTPPTPGKVAEFAEHAATGVWSGWLSNGARVHYKFSDYRKDQVSITVSLMGGELFEDANNRGITSASTIPWNLPATMNLSSTEVRALLSGRQVRANGRAGDDAIQMRVTGVPEDLELGMQLAHLLLTEPRIEAAAFEQWKTQVGQAAEGISKNLPQMHGEIVAELRYPAGEIRTRTLTRAQAEAMTVEKAQAWLAELIKTAPLEVAVVGDIDRERALDLVTRYIGSLPARERPAPGLFMDRRTLERSAGHREKRAEMQTQTARALVLYGFYGPDARDTAATTAMDVATAALATRLVKNVRENEQLVYSIRPSMQPGTTYPGFGIVQASAPSDPANADKLAARLPELFAEFAAGPTEEEVAQAKRQVILNFEERSKEPSYWSGVLEMATYDAINLDDLAKAREQIEAVTVEDVKRVFNKYYTKDSTILVVVKPAPGAAEAPKQP